jgi:ethanolamine permease
MFSFFALRKNEPDLDRPFKVPLYPFFPACALIIASLALVAMTIYNLKLALIYGLIMLAAYLWFLFTEKKN